MMDRFTLTPEQATRAAGQMRLYAQPQRLLILSMLLQGEHNVGEIEAATTIVQPGLSQQLSALRQAGIVSTRREARQVFYRLTDETCAARVRAALTLFGEATLPDSVTSAPASPRAAYAPASGGAIFARIV
ncbi:Transcriptional regulator, ArsR family [Granulibacter bethesdensis]|uniref:ArsR/SmtB family transcription factor n=1 Tax=Granulibacter bethesdensis TaxID=364410 RepID=UPI00090B377E|nr:Transcriptional regulator, ArsR family [Granulibacter bethesdensis]